jgi:hypothetical protein
MPAVSITRGLVLMTLRMPPQPQVAPVAKPWLVQQSLTKVETQVGLVGSLDVAGFKHCRQNIKKQHKVGAG